MNDEAVYRTAPATLGLLTRHSKQTQQAGAVLQTPLLLTNSLIQSVSQSSFSHHLSHVMRQVSGVMCQVSCVTFYFFLVFLGQSGGASRSAEGLLSTAPTPSSFFNALDFYRIFPFPH